MTIGDKIKAERLRLGFKQIELARKANISVGFLSDMENGRTNPSIKSLVKIAEALNTDCKFFLEGVDIDTYKE